MKERKCHSNRLILTNGASHQQIRRKRLCWRMSCRRGVIWTDMEKYWARPPSSATFLTSADGLKDTVSRMVMQTEAALCCSKSAKPQNIWACNLVFSAALRLRIRCHKEALDLLGSGNNLPIYKSKNIQSHADATLLGRTRGCCFFKFLNGSVSVY